MTGHEGESVTVPSLIFDSLQNDDLWDVDDTGYNFKHTLDVSANQVFLVAGRTYLVVFTLTPVSGQAIKSTNLSQMVPMLRHLQLLQRITFVTLLGTEHYCMVVQQAVRFGE